MDASPSDSVGKYCRSEDPIMSSRHQIVLPAKMQGKSDKVWRK